MTLHNQVYPLCSADLFAACSPPPLLVPFPPPPPFCLSLILQVTFASVLVTIINTICLICIIALSFCLKKHSQNQSESPQRRQRTNKFSESAKASYILNSLTATAILAVSVVVACLSTPVTNMSAAKHFWQQRFSLV